MFLNGTQMLKKSKKKKPHNYAYGSDSADKKNLWQSVDW